MISSKLRPVDAGYAINRRMAFLGSMMKTVRTWQTSLNGPVTANMRHTTHSKRKTLRVTVGGVLLVQHVIDGGDPAIRIRDLVSRYSI